MDRSSAPRPTDRGWTLSSRTPPAPDGWQSRTPDRGSTDEDIKVPFHTLSFCASGSPAVRADRAVNRIRLAQQKQQRIGAAIVRLQIFTCLCKHLFPPL